MNKIFQFLTGALMFSSLGFAQSCPDLSGHFTCQLGSQTYSMVIEKTANSYLIDRAGNQAEYKVDGNVYPIPSTDSYRSGQVKSFCSGDQLVVQFEADLLYEGSVVAHQVSRTNYYSDGQSLFVVQKVKARGVSLPTQKSICHSSL